MSSTVGFLTNAAAVTGITTSYDVTKGIALTNSVPVTTTLAIVGAENALTQGVYLDHIEIDGTNTGAVGTLSAWLSWDAVGDDRATATATITMEAALTTTTIVSGVGLIQGWFRPPGVTTLYLWLKTNANSIAIGVGGVRLHWTDGFSRS